jgi:chaperonin GroES
MQHKNLMDLPPFEQQQGIPHFCTNTMTRNAKERHVRLSSVSKHWKLCWFCLMATFPISSGWVLKIPSKSTSHTGSTSNHHSSLSLLMIETDASEDSENSPTSTVSSVKSTITLDGQEIRQPITAINNIVIVKVKDALSATGGGILLPDQSKQRPTEGLVIKAGPGKWHPFTGVRITNPVQEGMSVV